MATIGIEFGRRKTPFPHDITFAPYPFRNRSSLHRRSDVERWDARVYPFFEYGVFMRLNQIATLLFASSSLLGNGWAV